jgi:hypothetical protein
MLRRARILVALAAALPACGGGGDPVAVSVQMELDPATCSAIPDPAALALTCDATAGVWLRRASTGAVLDRACVDFAGDAPTLADLPPLLADIDLATTSSDGISVDVAVYAPWQSASGCPTVDELPASGETRPEVVVSGSSGAVDLSASPVPFQVVLDCGSIDAPIDGADCEMQCSDQQDECFDDSEILDCENQFGTCEDACSPADELCDAQCEADYAVCVTASPIGACELSFEDCAEGCPDQDDQCFADCDDGYDECVDTTCSGLFDGCTAGCEDEADAGCAVAAS